MTTYVQNLVSRLQQFSKDLDHKELFVEKPWVSLADGKTADYIFRRNGVLIVSEAGYAEEGTWEYISAGKALYLKFGSHKFLLKQAFVEDGLMLLKSDDFSTPWIAINRQIIPDLDYVGYLKRKVVEKYQLLSLKTITGKQYYYSNPDYDGLKLGLVFYNDDLEREERSLKIMAVDGATIFLKDGVVKNIVWTEKIEHKAGTIEVFKQNGETLRKGDEVKINGEVCSAGYYWIGEYYVKTENGVIVKRHNTTVLLAFLLFVAPFIILLSILLSIWLINSYYYQTTGSYKWIF